MDKLTVQAYDAQAEKYDRETTDFWRKFPNQFIKLFADSIDQKGKVIDIGSGPGRDAELLRTAGLEVTCLDASKSMVKLTKKKGFFSIQSDLLTLPFPESTFDGAWAYTSLLHVRKAEIIKAIQEIHRVLKPYGILGLGLIEGMDELYKISTKVTLPRLFSYYSIKEIRDLLTESHFSIFYEQVIKPGSHNYLHFLARKQ